jgi:hypothetical protein
MVSSNSITNASLLFSPLTPENNDSCALYADNCIGPY